MNDLDLVGTVLDEVPEPPPARLAAGRARLIAAAAEPVARPRATWTARRLLLPASLTAVAAAAMAAVLVAALAGGPAAGGSSRSGAGTAQSASLMAKVLAAAARAVAVRSDLLRALAGLSAGDRDVLLLIAWAGLTYDETAAAMAAVIVAVLAGDRK